MSWVHVCTQEDPRSARATASPFSRTYLLAPLPTRVNDAYTRLQLRGNGRMGGGASARSAQINARGAHAACADLFAYAARPDMRVGAGAHAGCADRAVRRPRVANRGQLSLIY